MRWKLDLAITGGTVVPIVQNREFFPGDLFDQEEGTFRISADKRFRATRSPMEV